MPSVEECVADLDAELDALLDDLVATYVHGSVALGGFVPGRSDLDLLVVAGPATRRDDLANAARAVHAAALRAPTRGIELSVVTTEAAGQPGPPWPFLLHVTTDKSDVKTILGVEHQGDPDLLMHYVVCRAAGLVVRGPDPTSLIGPVARGDVLKYLVAELRWAVGNAPEAYGVLNACRALEYLEDDRVVSKIEGAQLAVARGGPANLIEKALKMHRGAVHDRPPSSAARDFLDRVVNQLETAQ